MNVPTRVVCVAALLLTVAGCTPSTEERRGFIMPAGMEDCKVYGMSDGESYLNVVRCPNSTVTTTSGGKNKVTTVVIDGVEYTTKEK